MRRLLPNTRWHAERSRRSASTPTPSRTSPDRHAENRPRFPRRQHLVFRRVALGCFSSAHAVEPPDVILVSSAYAIDEAERNLEAADRRARFYRLLRQIEIGDEAPTTVALPRRIELSAKDQPILLAAIHAKCSHLLTGDHKDFGGFFGRSVKGVRILTVREYLTARGIDQQVG